MRTFGAGAAGTILRSPVTSLVSSDVRSAFAHAGKAGGQPGAYTPTFLIPCPSGDGRRNQSLNAIGDEPIGSVAKIAADEVVTRWMIDDLEVAALNQRFNPGN
jgi:hypothetical protein